MLKGGLGGGVSTVVKAIGHWLLVKGLATHFGPAGVSLHAQVVNLLNIFVILPQQGIGRGLVRILSEEEEKAGGYWRLGQKLTAVLFAVLLGALGVLHGLGLYDGIGYGLGWEWWAVFLACAYIYMHYPVLQGVLQAQQQFLAFSAFATLGSLLAAGFIWLLFTESLAWALLSLPLSLILTSSATWVYISQQGALSRGSPIPLKEGLAKLWPYILLALSGWVASSVQYGIRTFSIGELGLEQTSYWQAPATLSSYYLTAFSTTFLFIFYPAISKKVAKGEGVRAPLVKALLAMSVVIGLALYGIYAYRGWVIDTLFAPSLRGAIPLMGTHISGDFLGLLASILVYFLLAAGRFRWLLAQQLLGIATEVLVLVFLFEGWGIEAFPMAYACSKGVGLVVVVLGAVGFFR